MDFLVVGEFRLSGASLAGLSAPISSAFVLDRRARF